ncbi:hypothetical protein LWI28_012317 [Acer negundo]|uniref:Uncharacterized protein n=1 Tax=Acer negundo TaxID=4023 RepID=A0AAD5NLM4_ACENE|nr:hypothetical protein LWI28_012317 [Acer negundo]
MGLEEFEPIFGEPKLEWVNPKDPSPPGRFLFHVHSPDSSYLAIHVTDFLSNTWEAKRTVSQLEDMRDDIGIGGSWSDFIDYLTASIKSEDVKLVFQTNSHSDEQERSCLLTKVISAEKEKNEKIESQLEQHSKRQKSQNMNSSEMSDVSDPSMNNGLLNSPDKQSARDPVSSKVANRVIPAHRRAKVRGAILLDTEDDKHN